MEDFAEASVDMAESTAKVLIDRHAMTVHGEAKPGSAVRARKSTRRNKVAGKSN